MRELLWACSIYRRLALASIKAEMQYRFSFITLNFLRILTIIPDLLMIAVVVWRFGAIGGWEAYELALLYGCYVVSLTLFELGFREFDLFEQHLVKGTFDTVLLRPLPSLLTVAARKLELTRIGVVLHGLAVMAIGRQVATARAPSIPLATLGGTVGLFLLPLLGVALIFAMSVAVAAVGFWTVRIDDIRVFLVYAPSFASCYPQVIYHRALRFLFQTLLPVAFTSYIPLTYLLGKGGSGWHLLAAPVVIAVAVAASLKIWAIGENHYQSTGS